MRTNLILGENQPRLWRSRWAAIGAAVAVTFGAGGLFVANAASSVPSAAVTIDPVRILDTRDPANIGLPGPFVSTAPQKLQVTGPVPTATGTQTPVPAGATGVLLNVTVVSPSAEGFLAVRPGDATGAPTTSSLNFKAGDIVPNSVQVGLPTAGANAGQIDIFYKGGVAGATTEVLIDVVGYLVAERSGGTTVIEFSDPGDTGIPKDAVRATGFVRITAPTDGKIVVSASASVEAIQIPGPGVGGDTTCSITTGNAITAGQEILIQTSHVAPLAITRGFAAVAGESYDFSLLCETNLSDVVVRNLHMTAIFASTT